MYLTIGVGVGGFAFPDDIEGKPWVNYEPKAQKKFYRDKEAWKSTWNDNSVLQVDYVKVWAL